MVARHFNAWNRPKNGPSRRARYDGVNKDSPFDVAFVQVRKRLDAKKRSTPGVIIQTVPYGTDLFCRRFQALKCLATFIQSLRYKSTTKLSPATASLVAGLRNRASFPG